MKVYVKFHQMIPHLTKNQVQPIVVKCPICNHRNHLGFIVSAIVCGNCKCILHNEDEKGGE
jgi:hypothetical protein